MPPKPQPRPIPYPCPSGHPHFAVGLVMIPSSPDLLTSRMSHDVHGGLCSREKQFLSPSPPSGNTSFVSVSSWKPGVLGFSASQLPALTWTRPTLQILGPGLLSSRWAPSPARTSLHIAGIWPCHTSTPMYRGHCPDSCFLPDSSIRHSLPLAPGSRLLSSWEISISLLHAQFFFSCCP